MTLSNTSQRVSCQALQVFFEYAEAHGHDRKRLQEGLRYDATYLSRGGNWVDYETMLEVERRIAVLFPDQPQLFFDIGMSVGEGRSLGFLKTVTRVVISPFTIYRRIPALMRRFLFRFFEVRYEPVSWNRIVGHYTFDADCPPSDAFLETARGVLTSVPLFVGAPPAKVTFERLSTLTYRAEIRVRDWRGAGEHVRGVFASIRGLPSRRMAAERDAVVQLEDTNRLLQEKIDTLVATQRELESLRDSLADRVAERTAELSISQSQLEDTVDRLRRAHAAKNELIGNVSHEWKTPLSLIMAPLEEADTELSQHAPSSSALQRIREARSSANQLLQLVEELLDIATVDEEGMPLRAELFDIWEVVAQTCTQLLPLARRKRLQWNVATADEPCVVNADRKLVQRAVLNLVSNAVKYCREGDAVSVSVRPGEEAWAVIVQDTGPGIKKSRQAHVFKRFARGDDVASRAIAGSGIGLAMVRDIARLHGGDVTLKSAPGQGCTFVFKAPYQRDSDHQPSTNPSPNVGPIRPPAVKSDFAATDSGPTSTQPNSGELSPQDGRLYRVLVVEDDPQLREYLERVVGRRYEVLVAADGEAGLEVARRELPDLVLTDVMMPKMNGYQLCAALKSEASTRNIAVIILTARHGTQAALEGFASNADDFVAKPFSTREVLARIATQLRLRHLTTTLIRTEKQGMLSLLSAGIAHELLNPVNAVINGVAPVRMFLDATLAGEPPRLDAETCGELLDAIEQAGRRIDTTVRAVLTFTRSEDGPPAMQRARLSEGIAPLLLILRFRLRDIEVITDFAFDEELDCHPELMNQAVANLVVNAADAVPAVGGKIWISTEANGDEVWLRVRDNGPGVAPHLRERIFTPFFTDKDPGKGTGLGLSIGREIAALHGGRLELVPAPEGAEFALILPRTNRSTSHV